MICSECIASSICQVGRGGSQCNEFLKRVEALTKSAHHVPQQRHAEIAKLIGKHSIHASRSSDPMYRELLSELRQLSAV